MNYIYSKEHGRLLSMPVLKEPQVNYWGGINQSDADKIISGKAAYQEWLSNQPRTRKQDNWIDGKVYVKDVDFTVEWVGGEDHGNGNYRDRYVAIKKEDETGIISHANNQPSDSVASHCALGNSIEELVIALQNIASLYHADRSCGLEAQGFTEQECNQIGLDDRAAQIAMEALNNYKNKKL